MDWTVILFVVFYALWFASLFPGERLAYIGSFAPWACVGLLALRVLGHPQL